MTEVIVAPRAPAVVPEAIPAELRTMRNWLVWKYTTPLRPGLKWRKVPYYVRTQGPRGLQGTDDDRAGMGAFEEAFAKYQAEGRSGVGFAPLEGDGIVALDFDDCVDQGEIDPQVLELVAGTYAEISPSGNGIRAFYRGEVPQDEPRRTKPGEPAIEVFARKGYVTVTGKVLPGSGSALIPLPDHVADFIRRRIQDRYGPGGGGTGARYGWPIDQIWKCLDALPLNPYCDEYDEWCDVGMVIHQETGGSDEGFDIWDTWSARSNNYETREANLAKWASFNRHDREGRRVLTAASLRHWAAQHGVDVPLNPPASEDDFEDVAALQAAAREQIDTLLDAWEIVCDGPDEAIAEFKELGRNAALADDEMRALMARVSSATGQGTEAVAEAMGLELPRYANLLDLRDNPPPARQWVVRGWIPLGQVTLLSGAGGIGKTLLAQQLGTCIASGTAILGEPVEPGTVLGFLCEDDNDEIRRRQIPLLEHYRMKPEALAGRLFLEGRSGCASTMVTFGSDRRMRPGEFRKIVEAECQRLRPRLLVLDNIAHLFNGNANDTHEVTAFVNALTAIAVPLRCAVLLVGHVRKAVAGGETADFIGSVAWENTVRSRMLLSRRIDGLLELKRPKANYAGRESLLLEYRAGALVELDGLDDDTPEALAVVEGIVLQALRDFTARQVNTSHYPTARNNLIKLAEVDGLLDGTTSDAARLALSRLTRSGRVLPNENLPWRTADRKPARGLAIAEEAGLDQRDEGTA